VNVEIFGIRGDDFTDSFENFGIDGGGEMGKDFGSEIFRGCESVPR
jgi:hypothetical protein